MTHVLDAPILGGSAPERDVVSRALDVRPLQDAKKLPLRMLIVYVLASFAFVGSLGFASESVDTLTINVVANSHLAIPVLAVGISVLPYRFIWFAYAVFLLSFLLAELLLVGWAQSVGWSAWGMLKSLAVSTAVGTAGGAVFRVHASWKRKRSQDYFPEKSGLWAGLVVALSGSLLGGFILWITIRPTVDAETLQSLLLMLVFRSCRLGLVTAAGALFFQARSERASVPEILTIVLAFIALGLAHRLGFDLIAAADAPLLMLAILFARPIAPAVIGSLAGIVAFVALSGEYVDLPIGNGVHEWKEETLANALFLISLLVATLKVKSARVESVQLQALGRMKRSQELARFGYFMYDLKSQTAVFDALTQRILNVPAVVSSDGFLARVHPEDRDSVASSSISRDEAGSSFQFRFAMKGDWSEDALTQNFTGFALHDVDENDNPITYGIVVDVTREHAQEEHLRMVLSELSERQGQQTQMFSMISHELRTPASIIAMIADELDDGRPWQEVGPQMRGVLDQLLSILTDMRQTVRPEQNLPIRVETFRPVDLATGVREAFRSMADARGISIVLDMGEGAQERRSTDRVRLNQTISNLVKNAILHSQATEIRIKYEERHGPTGIWSVSDNGRNIPEKQKERLFHPFSRSQEDGARSDGSGLGLYIAKGAIELLGGKIEYIDRPMGGAEFRIELGMAVPESDAGHDADDDRKEAPDLSGLSVLILEDSETMGGLLVSRLSKVFREVKWLRDGASGLAWAGLNQPDVIISDLYMPGLSGDEIVRRLRSRGFECPIIGMTAAEMGDDVDRFRKSGVDAVITKPIRIRDLERALASSL